MSDPKIKQLQQDLKTLGYDPGPIDGLLGDKTRTALIRYAGNGVGAGEVLADPSALHAKAEAKRATQPALPPGYADFSDFCTNLGWRKKERAWSEIRGVTLHQTGCPMGESPSRWYDLKAHYGITYSGKIYRIHPETAMGWHAQGQSHANVGIEIAGFFAGIEGDASTRPGGQANWPIQSMTEAQGLAIKALVRYLAQLLEHHGSKLKEIEPHRTATNTRKPDPGSKVWGVALELIKELGCSDGQVTGDGEPIPEAWDPAKVGVKY